MPDHNLSERGSKPIARQSFVTLDDCIQSAEELLRRLSRLGERKHPLDVRKGLIVPVANKQESRTLKAFSRTYFFDVKTAKAGGKCLVITESRLSEQQRSQITIFPETAQEFVLVLREMADMLQQ